MLNIGAITLKNWLILAPMAGLTDLPFRLIAKKHGAALVTTEMVSAMGLIRNRDDNPRTKNRTFEYLKSHSSEKPLSVQIFGSSPEVMAEGARIVVEQGADIVDVNMGCPAKKIVKTGSGGALLKNTRALQAIVSAVRLACPVPLTVKIRAGWSRDLLGAVEIARIIEGCGADAVTVHPRFVTQGFSGQADWNIIARVKEAVDIPVIGNGDVFTSSLALTMKTFTGCDGVMIGRGAIGNPWIFNQTLELEKGMEVHPPSLTQRKSLVMEHFRLLSCAMGEKRAAKKMRGLLLRYTKGLPYSNRFRSVMVQVRDFGTLVSALDEYFSFLEEKEA